MAGVPNNPVPPAVPPTEIGYATPPTPPSAWPTVIGIIAIVFGVGGSLLGIFGLLSPIINKAIAQNMPTSQQTMLDSMAPPPLWAIVNSLITLGLAVLLLVAGITLMRRVASGRGLCRTWAVLKILLVTVNAVIGYFMATQMADAMTQMQQQNPAMQGAPAGFMQGMAGIGVCVGLVWGWALPIFMLIWFSRARIKEETASWSAAAAEPMP